ncbi:hypothetical protein Tco_0047814 [Tanacetum coccineum]
MYYRRFTKVNINHFMSKDQSILRRNKVDWHTARDDPILTTMRYISKYEVVQKCGAILPDTLTNQEMKESDAYKIYYAFASGKEIPKPKLKTTAKVAISGKKKLTVTVPKAKGLETLSEVALFEDEQMKIATKRSKTQFYSSNASGSGDGVNTQSKEEEEEKADNDEVSSDQRVSIPPDYEVTKEEENQEGDDYINEGEQEEEEEEDLYGDLNLNMERSDAEMIDAQANQETDDAHVTLIVEPLVVQQQSSSVSSDLVSKYINPILDTVLYCTRVSVLETEMSEFKQTSQFDEAVSSILGIIDNYLAFKMKYAVNVAVQIQSNKLIEEAQAENQEFLNQIDSNIKSIIKEQSSYTVAASLSEFELKKILIDKMEENKSIDILDIQKNLYNTLVKSYNSDKYILTSYGDVVTLKRGRDDQDKDEDPSAGSKINDIK